MLGEFLIQEFSVVGLKYMRMVSNAMDLGREKV